MKVGEHRKPETAREPLGKVAALMATYERPGLLEAAVRSFRETAPGVPLMVFDDGSENKAKLDELELVEKGLGTAVVRLGHGGFISTWLEAFAWSRANLDGFGGVVALEDDVEFSPGWLDVLKRMYEGTWDLGLKPGSMSCLRVHLEPQGAVMDLGGVEAYQSMGGGFQVNLFPMAMVKNEDLIAEAAGCACKGRYGLDVHLIGLMSHRMGRTSFISMQSWVAHNGVGMSMVEGQGYYAFQHRGVNLVEALERNGE